MIIREYFPEYERCSLCPRDCKVDRYKKTGYCQEYANLSIDSAFLHFGEEPPITHKNGSGTIFFTGCSLRCPFCQNMQISQNPGNKKNYSLKNFFSILDNLVNKNAENINFVTPDHFLPHIIEGIKHLRNNGVYIPTVYNCSGYQSLDNLKKAINYMDIFLFDYKFADKESAKYCIQNNDYPDIALKGLDFLIKNKGNLVIDSSGKALRGVLVRHLVMPSFVNNSIEVVNNLYSNFGNGVYLSLMCQYSPLHLKNGYDRISRKVTNEEYRKIVTLTKNLGFTNGFIQDEAITESECIPDFDKKRFYKK